MIKNNSEDLNICVKQKQYLLSGGFVKLRKLHVFKQDHHSKVIKLVCRRCGFVRWNR